MSQPGDDLQSAVLTKTDLSSANLNGALLFNATLLGASLDAATLVSCQLGNANLESAILTDADLSFANLTGAHLSKADLTSAITTSTVLTNAQYDEATVFPSGDTYDVAPWGLDGGSTPWDAGMIPTPEPSAGMMLLFGAAGLIGLARLERKS